MPSSRLHTAVAGLVVALTLAACATQQAERTQGSASLFNRLGGLPAIRLVIDDFVGFVAADNRINGRFANADAPKLKQRLVEQVCQGTGGPCTYQGKDMVSAHKGMNITDAEFSALVEDLIKALDKHKVPAQERSELLGILAPMKPAIVGQ